MPNIKISQLGAAAPTTTHVVAADNAAGTITHKIALGDIPGLAAPKTHASSHGLGQSDQITIAANQIVSALNPGSGDTVFDDLTNLQNDNLAQDTSIAVLSTAVGAMPGSFATASIDPAKVAPAYNPAAGTLTAEISDLYSADQDLQSSLSTLGGIVDTKAQFSTLGWTPTLRNSTNGSITGATVSTSGTGARIGDIVFLEGAMTFTAVPATPPAGSVWIGGLPYMPADTVVGTVYDPAVFYTAFHQVQLVASAGLNRIKIRFRSPSATGGGMTDATMAAFVVNSSFRFQIFFKTNDPW